MENGVKGVTITIEDELLRELRIGSDRVEERLRLELAVQLVATGIATSAQGARLAKLGRLEFLKELGSRQVSIVGDVDGHQSDLDALRNLPPQ
jgi:predicted HTH domain antitoxin